MNFSPDQYKLLGKLVVDALLIARTEGTNRIDTSYGSKTEEGVGRIIARLVDKSQYKIGN